MARPIQQTITCPSCGQPFPAILEQVLDTGIDPTVKERLLSGRVNLVACPQCGYQGMINTPLLYHDPSKQIAMVYMPMELNLPHEQRERMIGEMTNAVMRAMPEDAPRGYLLQPGTALTMQGLVDHILEADGITREMIDAERRKVDLLDELASASADETDRLLEENAELIDMSFLQLLTAAAQGATQQGENRTALRLLNLRGRLMESTDAGRQLKAQEEALAEASQELQALGEEISREQFVDLLVKAAPDETKVLALGSLGRMLLDYSTFELLSERIEQATGEERDQLVKAREQLLTIAAEYEKESRAIVERAVDTLRTLMQAPDIRSALEANLHRIDETFLMVLQTNLEESRRSGNVEASSRLNAIYEEVMGLIQASAPPEVKLINDLLSAEGDDEAIRILDERSEQLTPELLDVMAELVDQLRAAGNEAVAERLEMLQNEAARFVN